MQNTEYNSVVNWKISVVHWKIAKHFSVGNGAINESARIKILDERGTKTNLNKKFLLWNSYYMIVEEVDS